MSCGDHHSALSRLKLPLSTPPSRRVLRLLVVGLVLAASAGWAGWRIHATRQLRAAVPVIPDLTGRPPALAAALAAAMQQALVPSTATDGLAELGRLYQANNLMPQAEACWRILLRRAPGDGHWSYFLATLARTRGDDEAMAAWLRKSVESAPGYAPAWLKLAEWEFKTGAIDRAEADYRRRLTLAPGDPYAQLGLVRIAIARNQRQDARRQLEALAAAQPRFYPAHNLLAEILAQAGDQTGAAAQRQLGRAALRFREADDPWLDELKTRCFDVTQLSVWASIELSTDHSDHGIGLLERAIRIAPQDPTAYADLGQVYLQLHDPRRAQEILAQAVGLPGAPAEAYAGLSDAWRALGQPTEAIAAARHGLARLPTDGNLETALANSLRAAGQIDEALAAYRRAAQAAPNLAETQFNLGSALLQRHQVDEAREALQRALALKADFPPALLALGRLSLTAGDLDTAGRCARTLYAADPASAENRQLMAWWGLQAGNAAAQAGRSAEAEQHLLAGIAAEPQMPELQARLGVLYGQQGRYAEALATLQKYRELAPDEPMASAFLGQACLQLGRRAEARRFLSAGRDMAARRGDAAVAAFCERLLAGLEP